ncbi:hypothetical protein DFP72DRAFT_522427 [Ephemerocybe angulata]|uniref:Uncharacterized protein n=1 Tax=Ephemerocybe angulata TaxID=980116 RepID=A0A8H6IF63_9AGAR|nr:hypothetical protein DFP72DRAFT_522427 [Tulosesus angulatus]
MPLSVAWILYCPDSGMLVFGFLECLVFAFRVVGFFDFWLIVGKVSRVRNCACYSVVPFPQASRLHTIVIVSFGQKGPQFKFGYSPAHDIGKHRIDQVTGCADHP